MGFLVHRPFFSLGLGFLVSIRIDFISIILLWIFPQLDQCTRMALIPLLGSEFLSLHKIVLRALDRAWGKQVLVMNTSESEVFP